MRRSTLPQTFGETDDHDEVLARRRSPTLSRKKENTAEQQESGEKTENREVHEGTSWTEAKAVCCISQAFTNLLHLGGAA